ncbi:MAG: hypothetical protein ACTSYB_19010 [Candidatus Helarchaeota archaeon]
MKVISNMSPIIALLKKNELNLLKKLFHRIVIPPSVKDELIKSDSKDFSQINQLNNAIDKWILVENADDLIIQESTLGKGELEAINLSLKYRDCLLLMDEKKGRTIAKTMNIKTLGVLGILALAIKKDIKDKNEIIKNIETLLQQGFYLSSEVILFFLKSL